MSTQTERELFIAYAANKGWNIAPEQNNCGIVVPERFMHPRVQLASDVWTEARAPLLSRIAELEKLLAEEEQQSVTAWQQVAVQRTSFESRIDALSKDAERYHKIKEFMHVDPDVGDDEYKAIPGLCIAYDSLCEAAYIEAWGEESEMIDAAIDTLPAIAAAISAREGE